jgi:hypothetical protein
MQNNNNTDMIRFFSLMLIVIYAVCIFLVYDKIDIDAITYLKYLH